MSEKYLNYYKGDIFNIKLLINSVDWIYVISKYDNCSQALSYFINIVDNIYSGLDIVHNQFILDKMIKDYSINKEHRTISSDNKRSFYNYVYK